ncbi:hypothetical protein HAX54_038276 [Datura stramonium]|uniref:Uncharacterized protein n=1 Tax=Datura stramonium TaxID=4076 RepID=A0ABS8VMS5_DATST|nr:hypothetical protein [Datura stramonium]
MKEFDVMIGLDCYSPPSVGGSKLTTKGEDLVEKNDVASKEINEVVESYAAGDATRTDDDRHSCGGGYTPLDVGGAGGAGGRYTPIEALIEERVTEDAINKALASAKKKAASTPKMTADQPTERLSVNLYNNFIELLQQMQQLLHLLQQLNKFTATDAAVVPVIELWPRFLKQSGMFDDFPPKILNEEWIYERKKDLPKNKTWAACDPYSLAFIEHLITNISMDLLCDNTVEKMWWRWVVGVVDKELVS